MIQGLRMLVTLCLVLIAKISAEEASLSDQIYTSLTQSSHCVRLLYKDGQIGCTSPGDGWQGTIRLLDTVQGLDDLIATPPDYRISLLIPIDLFTRENLDKINQSNLKMAGIMLMDDDAPVGGFSPDLAFPQKEQDIHYPASQNYVWNTLGASSLTNSLFMVDVNYAVLALGPDETKTMKDRAEWNEKRVKNDEYPAYQVQFFNEMYASKSSIKCLHDSTCIPVGGYSVWSTFGRGINTTKEQVFAIAGADSSSFFHGLATGADADTSGVITLLATASTLSKVESVSHLDKQIVFALFAGESWSYVGSRKFVQDITHFTCDRKVNYDNNDGDQSLKACERPFRPTAEFTRLNITRINCILELNQVAWTNTTTLDVSQQQTIYVHREHSTNTGTDALVTKIKDVAAAVTGVNVESASANTPGVPPSSSQAFLRQRYSIPTIVLADHDEHFKNKYYHSKFDTYKQMLQSDASRQRLCATSTLLARTLFLQAGGEQSEADTIHTDCDYLNRLVHCLTTDYGCDLIRHYTDIAHDTTPSHYASVYQLMLRQYLGGLPKFYKLFLEEANLNQTKLVNGGKAEAVEDDNKLGAYYHDAVDPALTYDYDNAHWIVGDTSDTMLWTESNWGRSVSARLFRSENPKTELFMIILGFGTILVAAIASYFAQRQCQRHFKLL